MRDRMAQQGAFRLVDLLQAVHTTTPTERLRVTEPFLALWQDAVGSAYAAPDSRLLDLLIVSRAIAARAGGPEGEPYRREALFNTVRLSARLGEGFPGGALPELWREGP